MHREQTDPKVALITGAARRLGAAIAAQFHEAGFRVIVHCNDSLVQAGQVAGEFNRARKNSAMVLQADLSLDHEVTRLAEQAEKAWGRIDVIVNNASAFYATPLDVVTPGNWDHLVDGNLRGAFFLCQQLAGTLKKSHGTIVNVVDIYAEQPKLHYPVYSIAKAGLAAMTRSLAVELAPQVRVNGVAPGAILWPEQKQYEAVTQAQEAVLKTVPLGRTGEPADIAEAVYFLAVEGTYINGEVLRVDGGRRLNL